MNMCWQRESKMALCSTFLTVSEDSRYKLFCTKAESCLGNDWYVIIISVRHITGHYFVTPACGLLLHSTAFKCSPLSGLPWTSVTTSKTFEAKSRSYACCLLLALNVCQTFSVVVLLLIVLESTWFWKRSVVISCSVLQVLTLVYHLFNGSYICWPFASWM